MIVVLTIIFPLSSDSTAPSIPRPQLESVGQIIVVISVFYLICKEDPGIYPGTVLGAIFLYNWILTISLYVRYSYPLFIDKEIEAQRTEVTWPEPTANG